MPVDDGDHAGTFRSLQRHVETRAARYAIRQGQDHQAVRNRRIVDRADQFVDFLIGHLRLAHAAKRGRLPKLRS
jgi:hypothetical protein